MGCCAPSNAEIVEVALNEGCYSLGIKRSLKWNSADELFLATSVTRTETGYHGLIGTLQVVLLRNVLGVRLLLHSAAGWFGVARCVGHMLSRAASMKRFVYATAKRDGR